MELKRLPREAAFSIPSVTARERGLISTDIASSLNLHHRLFTVHP